MCKYRLGGGVSTREGQQPSIIPPSNIQPPQIQSPRIKKPKCAFLGTASVVRAAICNCAQHRDGGAQSEARARPCVTVTGAHPHLPFPSPFCGTHTGCPFWGRPRFGPFSVSRAGGGCVQTHSLFCFFWWCRRRGSGGGHHAPFFSRLAGLPLFMRA